MGWYHSHPHSPAAPSLQDIDAQMEYQLRLQGSNNGFQPCLALLCCEVPARLWVGGFTRPGPLRPQLQPVIVPTAPYYSGNPGPESKICPFWVMPPPEVGELEESELRDIDVSRQSGIARMREHPMGVRLGRGLRTRCSECRAGDSSSRLGWAISPSGPWHYGLGTGKASLTGPHLS